jgi:hypothetical protein
MVPWSEAYRRIREGNDFVTLFGRMYEMDEFRYYAYALKFDSVAPAQLAAAPGTPNTASLAVTAAQSAVPVNPTVPGPPSDQQIPFPAGAIILGLSSGGIALQRIVSAVGVGLTNFPYPPSDNDGGSRNLYTVDIEYADGDPVTAGNPVPETVTAPDSAFIAAPPYSVDALMGGGEDSEMPGRELYIAPGLILNVRVRSLLLPTVIAAPPSTPPPNLTVHVVFHAMIPGVVSKEKSAA